MTAPSQTPSSSPLRRDRILIAAGIILALLVFGELWRRISQASDLRSLEHQIGAQVTELSDESARMDTLIANAQSDQAVELWARGEGKMVQPGEVLVQPVAPAASTPTPAPFVLPQSNPPNWRVWWEWLFSSG